MTAPNAKVTFPDWYSGPYETEAEAKGYLYDVLVDYLGRIYRITFIDSYTREHDAGFADAPVVAIESVTREAIIAKIANMIEAGELSQYESGQSHE